MTAAHAVSWQDTVDVIIVGGTPRAVSRVAVHPGYGETSYGVRPGYYADWIAMTFAADADKQAR